MWVGVMVMVHGAYWTGSRDCALKATCSSQIPGWSFDDIKANWHKAKAIGFETQLSAWVTLSVFERPRGTIWIPFFFFRLS